MVLLFFCYFSSFNCTYVASNKAFIKRIKNKRYYYGLVFPAALLCSFLAVSLVLIITLYVVTVPVNNSIETTSEGVTSIYNGAVLIGGLLAYKIGWQYSGHSFSVSDALEDALECMEAPPADVRVKDWDNLTEERRLTEILKAVADSETLSEILRNPALRTACSEGQPPHVAGRENTEDISEQNTTEEEEHGC